MFWRIQSETLNTSPDTPTPQGRFVIHRHTDGEGPHLDLRLETDGCLTGWRIAATSLADLPWATAKPPHSPRWLDESGDAIREDAGVYAWEQRNRRGGTLILTGEHETRRIRIEPLETFPVPAARAILDAVRACNADIHDAARLIADGAAARQRAIARFCGLGRELDGDAFPESGWRDVLTRLTLDEIHTHLRAYEVRFDQKYPPAPVSQPEPLETEEQDHRAEAAMAIARGR